VAFIATAFGLFFGNASFPWFEPVLWLCFRWAI